MALELQWSSSCDITASAPRRSRMNTGFSLVQLEQNEVGWKCSPPPCSAPALCVWVWCRTKAQLGGKMGHGICSPTGSSFRKEPCCALESQPGGTEGVWASARLPHSKVQGPGSEEEGHFYPNDSNLRSFTCMRKELWYVGCQASAVLPGREGNSLDLPFISDKDTAAFEAITNRSWHSRPCARGESSIIQQKPRASSRLGLQPRLGTLPQHQTTPLLEISLPGKAPSARGRRNPQPTGFLCSSSGKGLMCWLMLPLCDLVTCPCLSSTKGLRKLGGLCQNIGPSPHSDCCGIYHFFSLFSSFYFCPLFLSFLFF